MKHPFFLNLIFIALFIIFLILSFIIDFFFIIPIVCFLPFSFRNKPKSKVDLVKNSIEESPNNESRNSNIRYCPNCGGEITKLIARFCYHCGEKLNNN